MTIAAAVRGILQDGGFPGVSAVDATGQLWHLENPSLLSAQSRGRAQQVDAVKRQVLAALARSGTAIIYHHESPHDEELPGLWLPGERPGAWRLPVDLDLADPAIAHWLFDLGNWTVCAPDVPLGRTPDIARAPAAQLLTWIDQQAIDVIVDSFHDDVSWVVVLGTEHHAA
jgi:hypothetical protein